MQKWSRVGIREMGFPDSSVGKESACNAGDVGLIPGLGRFPVEGKGYPLQYSGLENCKELDTTEQLLLSLFRDKGISHLPFEA